MTKLYDAYIHETTVRRLSIEAHSDDHAMAQACTIIEHERDWRHDAEMLNGGVVTVHAVHEAIPPEQKPYRVSFNEEARYVLYVEASSPEEARAIAERQLREGSSDTFEETANTRSPFTIEEVRS